MSKVIADGEEVIFEGDVPLEPSRVYELLMGALSEQGRVVVRFVVDEVDSLLEGKFPDTYENIEVFSLSHDELTLRLILESMKHLVQTEEQFEAYVRNILSVPWSEVFRQMDQLISKVQPFADLLDNLGPYAQTYNPPWKENFEDVAKDQLELGAQRHQRRHDLRVIAEYSPYVSYVGLIILGTDRVHLLGDLPPRLLRLDQIWCGLLAFAGVSKGEGGG